jgi:hypothetical protein
MIAIMLSREGKIRVGQRCAQLHDDEPSDLREGVELIGSKAVFEKVKAGTETIRFQVDRRLRLPLSWSVR